MLSSILEAGSGSLSPLQLEISPTLQDQAWQQTQQQHSNVAAQYNAYINYVCTYTFREWLEGWLAEEPSFKPTIWPEAESLSSVWEFVNGAAVDLGETRIVLISNEGEDLGKLDVPQEWVDIPSWAGDYYVTLQMVIEGDEDKDWVNVWGFTTHQQLRQEASYSKQERAYTLAADKLIEDLTVMQLTLGVVVKEEVTALPTLAPSKVKKLMGQLSDKEFYTPRLHPEISFQEWATLLERNELRQELYRRRIESNGEKSPISTVVSAPEEESSIVNLRQWLQTAGSRAGDILKEGWQAFEFYFSSFESIPVRGTDRSSREAKKLIDTSKAEVKSVLQLLEINQPEELRRQAAGVLGEIGTGKQEAIEALTRLLDTTEDEETRWQATLSLGKVDPGNPRASIRKARLIDLGIRISSQKILLVTSIMPKASNKLGIFLQVFSASKSQNLPPGLKLSVLSELGEVISGLEAEVRGDDHGQDKLIQLRFSPPLGSCFQVKISLGNEFIIENFIA